MYNELLVWLGGLICMFDWKNIYRGFFIGASDLIPGVSGGTIAVILGIYDQLIEAISGLFSKEWKKHIGFLIPLALGMGMALLLLSRVIKWLLQHAPQPTMFFFLGLIIGVVPLLLTEVDFKNQFTPWHYVILSLAAILIAVTEFFSETEGVLIETLATSSAITLFFSGWLGSMAMLLPGISGSLVLLLIGVYDTAINALTTFNIPIILTIGSGVAVGFIVSSKIIRYLLHHYHTIVYAAIIGLVVGSTVVIYPGFTGSTMLILLSVLTFILGLATVVSLGKKG